MNNGGSKGTAKLRRLNVAEMVATPPPPVPWRIEQIAADGALTMLFAQPGEGKSLIAATLSGAVVYGESVAGIGTMPGAVLYIDAEKRPVGDPPSRAPARPTG